MSLQVLVGVCNAFVQLVGILYSGVIAAYLKFPFDQGVRAVQLGFLEPHRGLLGTRHCRMLLMGGWFSTTVEVAGC